MTNPKNNKVEFVEVTIKLPKPIVDFYYAVLGFTKQYNETTIEESLARMIVANLKELLENPEVDMTEAFAGFDGASLIETYDLKKAFEVALSIVPIEQQTGN